MLTALSERLGRLILRSCASTGRIVILFFDTCVRLRHADIRETIRQMARLGADSLPIVLMTIMFTGMVLAVQTSKEFVRFGAASSVGGVVAIAMGRELAPVLTGVVVAGRVGAAIAAEIGTMKVTEQIDALRVMATNPTTYLVVPRFLAAASKPCQMVGTPKAIGSLGGWIVATSYAGISSFTYTNSIKVFMEPFDMISGMIKAAVFGAIIAIVGCHKGLHTRQGAEGVGISTTAAVVLSIILIFISNYFLSIILFVSGGK